MRSVPLGLRLVYAIALGLIPKRASEVRNNMRNSSAGLRTYSGAVAIVTGGASGIGKALGEELATRGCEVILADLQLEMAEEAAAAICGRGGKATAYALDVTDAEACELLLKDTFDRCKRLDYMFNNAGIAIAGEVRDMNLDHWRNVLDVNLFGVLYGTTAA